MNLRQFRWLVSQMKCAHCGQQLQARHVQVLGRQEDLWFLSVFCVGCQTQGLVAALVREVAKEVGEASPPVAEEPVTADDMLDMHNLLRTFEGDFRTLFAQGNKKGETA